MKILRLPLLDIIGTDIEEDVLYMIDKIKTSIPFEFKINMWYCNDELNDKSINKFKSNYNTMIEKNMICIYSLRGVEETVWFDIIDKKHADSLNRFKFRLIYDTYVQLPVRLLEFNTFAKGYNINKNGNKYAEKTSNNRFHKVGR